MKTQQAQVMFFALVCFALAPLAPAQARSHYAGDRKQTRFSSDASKVHRSIVDEIYGRGEKFYSQGDEAKAKKYYSQALVEVEKSPKSIASAPKTKLFRLEHDVLRLYPNYPKDKARAEGQRQIDFDEEELATLGRIKHINEECGVKNVDTSAIEGQFIRATMDLEKNKKELEQKSGSDTQK